MPKVNPTVIPKIINIYEESLFSLGLGIPVWFADQEPGGPQLGDVGYHDSQGRPVRLFNAMHERGHDLNRNVPRTFTFDPIELGEHEILSGTFSHSHTDDPTPIVAKNMRATGDGKGRWSFLKGSGPGAFFFFLKDIQFRALDNPRALPQYFLDNLESWLDLAKEERGEDITDEDLYFVTSVGRTTGFIACGAFLPGNNVQFDIDVGARVLPLSGHTSGGVIGLQRLREGVEATVFVEYAKMKRRSAGADTEKSPLRSENTIVNLHKIVLDHILKVRAESASKSTRFPARKPKEVEDVAMVYTSGLEVLFSGRAGSVDPRIEVQDALSANQLKIVEEVYGTAVDGHKRKVAMLRHSTPSLSPMQKLSNILKKANFGSGVLDDEASY